MANLDQAPSRSMPNLLHVLPASRMNPSCVEHDRRAQPNTINKYELITETGHLKLIVGYSSLSYPRLRLYSLG